MEATRKPRSADDFMCFGKYRHMKLWQVIEADPGYIAWCIDEIPGFELDNESYAHWRKVVRIKASR